MSIELQKLADTLNIEYRGPAGVEVSGVASLASAGPVDLCFVEKRRYLDEARSSRCAAVITSDVLAGELDKPVLVSAEPYFSFVLAIEALGLSTQTAPDGIHPSAEIADDALLGSDVSIGAQSVIGPGVEIGDGTTIGAGVVIETGASLGAGCRIHAGVVLGRAVRLGQRCIVQAGAVIGADGFGLLMHEGAWRKIPHLGSVRIEDDVEIGANTTIDRGALDDTVIETGCKLDNLIQVAHNVHIGAHTAIAACVGIAGSARIGRYCKISGAAVVLGHLSVADEVTVTAMSLVTKDIREAGVYSSGTPLLENALWHRNNVRYKSLDKLAQRLDRLEKNRD